MLEQLLTSRYRLIQPLVTGGFSQTYLATDVHLPGQPHCVVKKLQPTVIDEKSLELARRLFNSEAEALQKVGKHPQIPSLLAYFEEDQEFYLVQDFIRGITLEELLPLRTYLPQSEVIALLQDCLGILEFVHSHGVIHRDIKPANLIQRQEDGKMVLLDFGAVKQLRVGQRHLVAPTIGIGTAGYTPDEQLRGRPNFTSDLYALGMIAIQALTGLEPERLERDGNDELVWQPQVAVSPGFTEILSKMVHWDHRQRYQSAADLLAVIGEIQITPHRSVSFETKRIEGNPTAQLLMATHEVTASATQARLGEQTLLATQGKHSSLSKQIIQACEQIVQANVTEQHDLDHPQENTLSSEPLSHETIESATQSGVSIPNSVTKISDSRTKLQVAEPATPTDESHWVWLKSNKVTVVSLILLLSGTAAGVFSVYRTVALARTIDRLESLYDQEQYTECIRHAEGAIAKLQIPNGSIRELLDQCQLGTAQLKANQSSYADAIEIVSQIPQESPYYPQAQQNIETWSGKILAYATQVYEEQGKLNAALEVMKQIPTTSSVSEVAAKRSIQWRESYKIDSALIKAAEINLKKGQSEDAITKVEKVKGPQYLKQKADKIQQMAREQIASRPSPTPARTWQSVSTAPASVSPAPARSIPAAPPPPSPYYDPPPRPLATVPQWLPDIMPQDVIPEQYVSIEELQPDL